MTRDDSDPGSRSEPGRDGPSAVEQGKQFVSDLRDTVGKQVADREDTLRGFVGKAARWVDEKTGGKYADTITQTETRVNDGIGRLAAQGSGDGTPQGPGSAAGDGTDDPGPAQPPRPTGADGPRTDPPTDPGR